MGFFDRLDSYGINNDMANENLLITTNDIRINMDKWKPEKGKNILFVTGFSGSGKSTIAELIEKDNYGKAFIFSLDGLQQNFDSSNKGILDQVIKKYPSIFEIGNQLSRGNLTGIGIFKDALHYSISIMKEDYKNLYIVEGIQIYGLLDSSVIGNSPVYIKGTSAVKSISRRLKRDKEQLSAKDIMGYLKWYIDDNKQINKFKKDIKKYK